ncbi:MAG: TIGR03084 family metal-binding protein [Parvularcula sp.]|jgi:uncharacterized protein (TIGR03084 family)|nr:TIGR03084 family metal-binding protein [Parvularcula sp.]
MKEVDFFLEESEALNDLLLAERLSYDRNTLFKGWSIDGILRHLHFWNDAARLSLLDGDGFASMLRAAFPKLASLGIRGYEDETLGHLAGEGLRETWLAGARATADAFSDADPEQRVPWAGPPMSARSSIAARLMETWAHAQAIYDAAGVVREDTDRIYPIAELGVRTFGWTYQVRGEAKPSRKPFVSLTAPSGDVWQFNEASEDERIEGPATAFCQVVTQTRNIHDVSLSVRGPIANDWMSKAQCFAGTAENPPPPGLRRTEAQR